VLQGLEVIFQISFGLIDSAACGHIPRADRGTTLEDGRSTDG